MSESRPPPILLIEDDSDVRAATTHLLEANGYSVVAASNGREALRRLRDGVRPALILLDLGMPVMDGATFRVEQVRDAALRSIPVVVLSGDGAVRASAVFAGVAHYQKPLDGENLLVIVARYASMERVAAPRGPGVDGVRIEIRRDPSSANRVGRREVRGRRLSLLRGRRGRR